MADESKPAHKADQSAGATQALREFQEVESRGEGLKMIREGAKTLASVMIWTKDQGQVFNTHLTVYSDSTQTFYAMAPKGFDQKLFEDYLAKNALSECYFSASLQRANLFFKAKYVLTDHAGLKFAFPDRVFKVQRRRALRFPIPDGHVLRVKFPDPINPESSMSRKVLDLSSGGIAFLVDDAEAPVFFHDLRLIDLTFTVKGRKITINAVIRYKRELKDDPRHKGWKIGVEFEGLKPADSQFIAAYVFEESRKFFSRYI